jgi:hypothetical protein
LTLLADEEFGRLFETFEHTAFRLEVRDRYNAPYEDQSLEKFLAGEPEYIDDGFQEWLDLVRTATGEGRRFSRVRVVSLPLSDYSRYGIAYAHYTNDAGDDIRYLTRDRARAIGLPDHDYWLFDSRKIAVALRRGRRPSPRRGGHRRPGGDRAAQLLAGRGPALGRPPG